MYRAAAYRGLSSSPRTSTPTSRLPSATDFTNAGGNNNNDDVYVLTLQTDAALHANMTRLRDEYFPPALNRLEAHLTLFHALPGARLDSVIIPHLEAVVARTRTFSITANRVFRLRRGIAINVMTPRRNSDQSGGRDGTDVAHVLHEELQRSWMGSASNSGEESSDGFLTQQDAGPCRLHFTIMNKADDEDEIARAFENLKSSWTPYKGRATGLGLWRYDAGNWVWQREFAFQGMPET